jgi:hypothetical protein
MRCSIAILLLLTFGSFLSAPLLAAQSAPRSEPPICCKGKGDHRGMMGMMTGSDPSQRQISRSSEKCPSCPKGMLPITTQIDLFTPSWTAILRANLLSHPACAVQAQARYRVSSDRSRQKRGPPAPSSLA